MKIGIFAFGQAGCRIADQFTRFESRTRTTVSEFILAADTSRTQLNSLSHIEEDNQLLYGRQKFEGRGSRADLLPAIRVTKHLSNNITNAVNSTSRRDLDAFLVIGSLGGGTGGAGTSVASEVLSEKYPNIPVYAVGILPGEREAKMYRRNAAKTIQSVSANSNNLILFDNQHLGVTTPESNPDYPDDADSLTVFEDINQHIARSIHLLFSADEVKTPDHLAGTTATTEQLIKSLNTGGLSTMCYVAETLPRAARPGLLARIPEMIEYFRVTQKQKRYEQQRQRQNSGADQDGKPNLGLGNSYIEADNVTVGTGPGSDAQKAEEGTLTAKENTIHSEKLPEIPSQVTDSEDPGNSSQSTTPNTENQQSEDRPTVDRDWPHPAKLVPLTLDPTSAMMNFNPKISARNLFLLIGPKKHLSQQSAISTTDWAEEHTDAGYSITKNYPVRDKKVAVLRLCSGIGIPERLRELQKDASQITQGALQKKEENPDPKEFNIFDNEDTLPPAL